MGQTQLLAVDFTSGIEDSFASVAKFVPKLIAFLIILLIGWLVARVIAKLVRTILAKVGFQRVIDKSGLDDKLRNSQFDAIEIIAKLLYYAILLIVLQVAFSVFGPNPISELLKGVVAWIPQLVIAIIIVLIVAAIANAVKALVSSALSSVSYGKLLANLASGFILALGVIAALHQIGVAVAVTLPVLITVLATVGGILVVGVGGGLIKPMQERWSRWLDGAERETSRLRASGGTGGTGGTGGGTGGTGGAGGASPGR
ncbi:hypothetical protein JGS22_010365 [Streptomyces sp. P38-E01]|uniref:Uncharacterized protein n=1 Tax=Streptomyces tardus TaxID=2780544 RepID=A0A949JEJ8_9ACTN|nr:hypothetical protein [Streptomyces tardus]MBU7598002.1 hypothetical protein [Streptomyces tardus]